MADKINILHLSDLHFGIEPSSEIAPTAIAQRKNTLYDLLKKLSDIEAEWSPGVVVISGDIGWKGKKEDYGDAKTWIGSLLSQLKLTPNELILCPGNHDIDRDRTKGMNPPYSPQDADDWLKIENLDNFVRPFEAFGTFYDDIKVPKLTTGTYSCQLMGQREVEGIRFIVLNSAWFSRGKKDKGNLWIGHPQIDVMKAEGQLINPAKYDDEIITVSILHHPPTDLHDAEYNTYGSRKSAYFYLSEHCHAILCGHSHGSIEPPHREYNRTYLFKNGAVYAGKDYRNNFSLLQLDIQNRRISRCSFQFNPGDGNWQRVDDNDPYELRQKSILIEGKGIEKSAYDYKYLSQKAKEAAKHYIEYKSSILSQSGVLPDFIERKVAVHNKEERIDSQKDSNRIHLKTKRNLASLSEMVSDERPTFLFGELGSGKSTLVGQYVIGLADQVEGLVPILIPAKFFQNKTQETIIEFSQLISRYVNEQINPVNDNFDLITALKLKLEITLVFDGFDELDFPFAKKLLARSEEFASKWSGLRIIATGRPIELQGLNYNRWQCLEMLPLSNDEQFDLFINEAIALEMTAKQAKDDASARMLLLKQSPELLSISTTPLTVRLLRPSLDQTGVKKSIGDLLYELIIERLSDWSIKDEKEEFFTQFQQAFPDSFSRERLLGNIVWDIHSSSKKTITKERLFTLIEAGVDDNQNKNAIISQGITFFIKNILQQEGDEFSFPSMPLFQCALGIYILKNLEKDKIYLYSDSDTTIWREFSFAAAIARRKGQIPKLKITFKKYIDHLLKKKTLPCAATVVSEARDTDLARHFVCELKNFDFRPLTYFEEFKSLSPAAYAHCFYLAGEEGFNWFFNEYLDPKYPICNLDTRHALILQHWLLLCEFKISISQKKAMGKIPMPHLKSRSWGAHALLPTIATVLPELFEPSTRALLLVECFSSPLIRGKALASLRQEYNNANQPHILNALETKCSKNDSTNSAFAAKLWLEFSPGKPPLSIVHAIITSSVTEDGKLLYSELEKRIGKKNLHASLRWYALQGDKLSIHAALLLHASKDKKFYLLATGLIAGLHDGGKVTGAEEALYSNIQTEGPKGLLWFVNQFPKTGGVSEGAHSAYWRILLKELNRYDADYSHWFNFTIRYLGEFILPRYPDIRREFQKLFSTKPNYKKTLDNLLKSFDAQTRFNAACILIACFPESECLAAEIVIAATSKAFEKHEWNRFCLRLSLGKEVLDHIASRLDSFLDVPKTFALSLLYHNGFFLSKDQFERLIIGLLKEGSFDFGNSRTDDNLKPILGEEESYNLLLKIITEDSSYSEKAAERLFEFHQDKLSSEHRAKCLPYVINGMDFWNTRRLDVEAERFIENPEFTEQVSHVAQKVTKEKHEEPIIAIYLRILAGDPSAWKDLLWKGVFGRHFDHHRIENVCLWLFSKGRRDIKDGRLIGKAALEIINDPRIDSQKAYNDKILWLGFLAHEFGCLQNIELKKFIVNYAAIGQEIVCSLIARLGYAPDEFTPRDRSSYLTVFRQNKPIAVKKPKIDHLIEVTRDAEEIHPDFLNYIEVVLLSGEYSEEEINELSHKSKIGILFSIMIFFARNSLHSHELIFSLISLRLSDSPQPNQKTKQIENVFKVIRKILIEGPERKKYISSIHYEIQHNQNENVIHLFRELLENEIPPDDSLIPMLLNEIASHSYYLDWNLANHLAHYFIRIDKEDKKVSLLTEIKKFIQTKGAEVNKYDYQGQPLVCLLFSLAVFYLQNDLDGESEKVFLHGLQASFIQRYENRSQYNDNSKFPLRDTMNAIDPLLNETPRWIIRKAIANGADSDLPEIRTICKILLALVHTK